MYGTSTIADKNLYRVLVVDDDPEFSAFTRTVAEDCGCEVTTATKIAEMETRLEERVPNLIFLDLVMPGEDGIKFLDHLQALNYSNDIIIISAYHRYLANATNLAKTQGLNCREPITKPVSTRELSDAIYMAKSDARSAA